VSTEIRGNNDEENSNKAIIPEYKTEFLKARKQFNVS
jgi:hypothetical protein